MSSFDGVMIDKAVAAIQDVNSPLDLQGILDDIQDNHFCHLSDWHIMASVPIKSSIHGSGIQFLQMLLIYLLGDEGFKAQSTEFLQLTDPEFTLQEIKYVQAGSNVVGNVVNVPAPFHQQKHGMESCHRQTPLMLLMLLPYYRYLLCKPSINDTLDV